MSPRSTNHCFASVTTPEKQLSKGPQVITDPIRKSGKIGTTPVIIYDPSDAPPDACVLFCASPTEPDLATQLTRETGLRILTSQGATLDIAPALLADPKLPLTLCALGQAASETCAALPSLCQTRNRPTGVLLLSPPENLDTSWLSASRLPPICIAATTPHDTAAALTKTIRKAGHRVHLVTLTSPDPTALSPQDHLSLAMTLSALARNMWPH